MTEKTALRRVLRALEGGTPMETLPKGYRTTLRRVGKIAVVDVQISDDKIVLTAVRTGGKRAGREGVAY